MSEADTIKYWGDGCLHVEVADTVTLRVGQRAPDARTNPDVPEIHVTLPTNSRQAWLTPYQAEQVGRILLRLAGVDEGRVKLPAVGLSDE